MIKYFLFSLTLILGSLFITNCGTESITLEPQQNITRLTYTLTPENGGQTVVFTYDDEDGSGGSTATISGGTLNKSTIYFGEVELLAISNDTIIDITASIRQDGRDNQFFYTSSNPALIVSYEDADLDGNPIGISSKLTTVNNTGEGPLNLTLIHNPDKDGLAVSGGNKSLAGGRTDFDIDFPVIVE